VRCHTVRVSVYVYFRMVCVCGERVCVLENGLCACAWKMCFLNVRAWGDKRERDKERERERERFDTRGLQATHKGIDQLQDRFDEIEAVRFFSLSLSLSLSMPLPLPLPLPLPPPPLSVPDLTSFPSPQTHTQKRARARSRFVS
jgi:hypothetical protein